MPAQMRLRRNRFKNISHRNIFDSALKLKVETKYLTILAPGRMGIEGYDFLEQEIPREDNTIVAVNFGVEIAHELNRPYLEADIWMVADPRAVDQIIKPDTTPWFPRAIERFRGQKIFALKVVEVCWKRLKHPGPYYSYASKHLMKGGDVKPVPSVIRAGGSIGCGAVQFGHEFHKHPEKVMLICGVDMSGDDYIRGSNTDKSHGPVWPGVTCLGRVIEDRISRGSNIFTVSETKLLDNGYIEYYPQYLIWRDRKLTPPPGEEPTTEDVPATLARILSAKS